MRSNSLLFIAFALGSRALLSAETPAPLVEAPHWKKTAYSYETTARDPFSVELAPLVSAPERYPLRFVKKSGPTWLTVSTSGQIGGIPDDANVGANPLVVIASNEGGTAAANFSIQVQFKNHPPRVDDSALRFKVKERETLHVQLNRRPYAEDPDRGDHLSFTLGGEKNAWLQVSKTGELTAAPVFAQIGDYAFPLLVSDGTATTTGTLQVSVERSPRPPVWKQPKLELKIHARAPLRESLKALASDHDGLSLVFEKKAGPLWVKVGADGSLSGSPQDSDVGVQQLVVAAKNDVASADLPITLNVIFSRRGPFFLKNNVALPKAKITEEFHYRLAAFAVDPDPPHTLVFSMVSGPKWMRLSPEGRMDSTQPLPQVGNFPIVVRVTNSDNQTAEARFDLTVGGKNSPPKLLKNPVELAPIKVGELLIFDLKPFVNDPDGDPLTFKSKDSPDWLSVAKTGELTGVPEESEHGNFQFDVDITDGRETVRCHVTGKVLPHATSASAH